MTKQQLKEWVAENCLTSKLIDDLFSKIDQLSEPEPDNIPFQFPVPSGYEVVNKLGEVFKPFCEPEDCSVPGRFGEKGWTIIHIENLFLRKFAPELVTVWLNYYDDNCGCNGSWYSDKCDADNFALSNRIGPAIRVQFEKPKP